MASRPPAVMQALVASRASQRAQNSASVRIRSVLLGLGLSCSSVESRSRRPCRDPCDVGDRRRTRLLQIGPKGNVTTVLDCRVGPEPPVELRCKRGQPRRNTIRKLLLIVIVALALPAGAFAKGPSSASIQGPGLKTVTISGDGEDGGVSLFGRLTEAAGFFPAVFRPSPDPMLQTRPEGDLGPRYKITWVLPTPAGKSTLQQDAYPYAKPHPLTYMSSGQTFYNGMTTNGGWYVSGPQLSHALVSLFRGAQAAPPAPPAGDSTGLSTGSVVGVAAAGTCVLLALALLLVTRFRRRSRSAVTA
jgi:hypothetical protein